MKTAGDSQSMMLTEKSSSGGHPENVVGGEHERKEDLCGHPVKVAPVGSGRRWAGANGGKTRFAGVGGEVVVEKFIEEVSEVFVGDCSVFNVVE